MLEFTDIQRHAQQSINHEDRQGESGEFVNSPDLLRDAIHAHLVQSGFTKNGKGYYIAGELTKDKIRFIHSIKRQEVIAKNLSFIDRFGDDLLTDFADGTEIDPNKIKPKLIEVRPGSRDSLLFRYAGLLWSVPVSQGFGRRIRYLVRDDQNGKLIGLFALGDPVFNLAARDNWIGWNHQDRRERLVHVMDAYVVGAVPPYSLLIGGKMIAALMGSEEVQKVYQRKYYGLTSVIREKKNRAKLALITTTSALGKSSLYNRLRIPGGPSFQKIGETRGFGHFHLSGDIFESMKEYLSVLDHPYAHGNKFGMGPNWRIRVVRTTLEKLGFQADHILKHGIPREVYAMPLADNWKEILLGTDKKVQTHVLPASEIVQYCLDRWIIPRSKRNNEYLKITRMMIADSIGDRSTSISDKAT